jgi:VWFA-related protein
LSARIPRERAEGVEVIRHSAKLLIALFPLGLLVFGSVGAFGQIDPGEDIRYRLRTSVELVLVPVTVKDREGNLVTGLEREDFQLLENGVPQPIRYFSVDPFPLSAVLLVDVGLEPSAQKVVGETLSAFASAFAVDDEFSLFVFDSYPRRVLDFTRDTEPLRSALRAFAKKSSTASGAPSGLTGGPMSAGPRINSVPVGPGVPSPVPQAAKPVKSIHDALFAAGMALRAREPGRRRVVFIISDGRNSRLNVRSFEEARDLLLTEDVSVFAIGVAEARLALGTTVLSDYAAATGGDFYSPAKQDSLARAYMRVAEQARYQYTLVYVARAAPSSREYRRIKVEAHYAGATVHARDGYFAGVPQH